MLAGVRVGAAHSEGIGEGGGGEGLGAGDGDGGGGGPPCAIAAARSRRGMTRPLTSLTCWNGRGGKGAAG
jgi:hypothetical protein